MMGHVKKHIKKSFLGIVLLLISNGISFAAEEYEPAFGLDMSLQTSWEFDAMSEQSVCEAEKSAPKVFEECAFENWMNPIGRNTFNGMKPEEQQRFREKVTNQASQLAAFICEKHGYKGVEEDPLTITDYIRQIANDQNPIKEDPSWVKKNEGHPNYRLVIGIGDAFYKAITGQVLLVNGYMVEREALKYLNGLELPAGCSIIGLK